MRRAQVGRCALREDVTQARAARPRHRVCKPERGAALSAAQTFPRPDRSTEKEAHSGEIETAQHGIKQGRRRLDPDELNPAQRCRFVAMRIIAAYTARLADECAFRGHGGPLIDCRQSPPYAVRCVAH